MKKRKLNSKNPKYQTKDENIPKVRKEFVHEVIICSSFIGDLAPLNDVL